MRAPVLLAWLLAALLALSPHGDVRAGGLLTNGGFEDGVSAWQALGGDIDVVAAPVAEGNLAAVLTVDEGWETVRASQQAALRPGGTYRFSGQALLDDPKVEFVWLEITWTEAGGTTDRQSSWPLTSPDGSYRQLATPPLLLPCGDFNVQVDIIVQRESPAGPARAYVDDLRLESVAPPVSCPTPTSPPAPDPDPRPTTPGPEPTVPGPDASPTPPSPDPQPTEPSPAPQPTGPGPGPQPTETLDPVPPPQAPPTPSHGLLVNGGFEAAQDGRPLAWRTQGGELTQVSVPVRSGRFAGGFASTTGSTKWVYQTVVVAPGAWYELEAYVYLDGPGVEAAFLRVSWYASADGSGTAMSTVDSTMQLGEPADRYRRLSTGVVQAPAGVHSAKVRVLLRPRSSAGVSIYIDDVSFRPAAPGPGPTPAGPSDPAPPAPPGSGPQPTETLSPVPPPQAPPTPSHGLLVNGGFEVAQDGRPLAWRTQGGELTQVSAPVRSGQFAGGFASTTGSTKWVYQTVVVAPGAWYELEAYVYLDGPGAEAAFLRVSWYASGDGSGSAAATVDSEGQLEEPEGRYRRLSTGVVQAPAGVYSAKVRVLLRPRSSAGASIYIDDVSFRPAAPGPAVAGVARAGNRPGGRLDGRVLSAVMGASQRDGAPPYAPMPTPVIRRSSQATAESQSPVGGGLSWWPWALAGGVLAAGAAGWAGYRWRERRRARDGTA